MQLGYVEALQIQRKKGVPFERVSTVELEAGRGIVGDCHALGGEKQIVLISSKTKQWMTKQEIKGFCFLKFKENIVTQRIDYSLLSEGDVLITDHARIEISSYSKHCYLECILKHDNQPCELNLGTRFGKVLQSGKIQVGDRIWSVNRKNIVQ